ncbi:LLM class flavin-dependent oxidoreductase [Streptomyces sp. BV286]|uniref:LLM class flavin-dependent oxidoreductase n=1 Tax=Streptomyces sp. BV286 TaxID=2849672 RepID=UPI001C2DF367|nr:LLM class flavin-dependent oxidoreductase [Streptomyces sp. BV286]MBV1942041.1 LLM class flavin-dependent oxidoreductase [Streptomyces sp. BV286]
MAAPHGRGLLHLAAAVDQEAVHDVSDHGELVRLAERGGFDFVTLGDTFARPEPDALAVLARIASTTTRIGLVPTVTVTHTEPFHLRAAVATLDRVSRGRAGCRIDLSDTEGGARNVGRRHAASADASEHEPEHEAWDEAGQVADLADRLWDNRAVDAGTHDDASGRPLGRDEARPAGFEGDSFPVRGLPTVARPSQGHPVTVVDATDRRARAAAARCADVALVQGTNPAQVGEVRAELHASALAHGRDPDELRVLAALTVDLGDGERAAEPGHGGGGPRQTGQGPLYRGGPVDLAELIASWHETGAADGFHLTPAEPRRDLERLVNGTVALLQHRGLFRTFYPGSTLREHLGLTRPAKRYAVTREAP